jgi:hypothetical protein
MATATTNPERRSRCGGTPVGAGLVRRGKYHDGRFSDELVDACRRLVEEWRPEPFPTWVTCIPSLRHPDLVPDFARRLATALDLPFELVLVKTEERPEQKSMKNSAHQAHNLDGALAIVEGGIPEGAGSARRRHGGLAVDDDGCGLAAALEREW